MSAGAGGESGGGGGGESGGGGGGGGASSGRGGTDGNSAISGDKDKCYEGVVVSLSIDGIKAIMYVSRRIFL